MKYKPFVHNSSPLVIAIKDESMLLYLYDEDYANTTLWPDGFWYYPGYTLRTNLNRDYHDNRDEYITEIKKLIIKEML